MTLLAAGKPLRIYPWGNSEQDLPPQTLSLCLSLPLGFASAQKQGGDHKHPYCCPRGASVTCPAAVGHKNENLERLEQQRVAPSVCLAARCFWISGASSTRQLQDQHRHKTEARDMMLFFPDHLHPFPRRVQGTERPSSFHNRKEKEGNKPPNF